MQKNQVRLSIRTKIIFFILASSFFLAIGVFAISSKLLLGSYTDIEKQGIEKDLQRVESAITTNLTYLGISLVDWAHWDDSYTFVQDQNQAFIASNLENSSLANLGLNIMIFIDENGQLVFSKAIDPETVTDTPSEDITKRILSKEIFTTHTYADSIASGIISVPQGLMLIASGPILNNDLDGPIEGTLIFGKFLDENQIQTLKETTHLSFEILPINDWSSREDVKAAEEVLNSGEPFTVTPIAKNIAVGYTYLYHINNTPIALLRLEAPRVVYAQGLETFTIFILFIGFLIIFIGFSTYITLSKLLLTRFALLSTEMENISRTRDLSKRVQEGVQDEVGTLAISINNMLTKLSEAQEAERKFRILEKSVEKKSVEKAKETEELNKLMVGRELKMIELKAKIQELNEKIGTC